MWCCDKIFIAVFNFVTESYDNDAQPVSTEEGENKSIQIYEIVTH